MSFEDKLKNLCAREMAEADNDHERKAAAFTALAQALGFTIALSADGHPQLISELIEGATALAMEEAVHKAKFAEMMALPRKVREE
jgi:flagellar biosynthesis protein FliR